MKMSMCTLSLRKLMCGESTTGHTKTQTNLYVLSLPELSTHWTFCFALLTKILNESCEAPSIRFSPHPPCARHMPASRAAP